MSMFSEMLSGPGADQLLAASGEPVEFRPGGRITAIVSEEREMVRETATGRQTVRERSFSVHVDATSRFGGIDKPGEGIQVIYIDRWNRTCKYNVREIPAAGAGLVTLIGIRVAMTERTREGARGGR